MIKLDTLIAELEDKKVSYSDLVVCNVGNETVLGEVVGTLVVGASVTIKNHKRFMRLQVPRDGLLMIDFLVGDYDLIDEGVILIKPSIAYRVLDQSVLAQTDFCRYYLSYLEKRVMTNAMAAGLSLPGLVAR